MKLPGATHPIVTGCSRELLEDRVKPIIEQFLRERGLELSQEKTTITHIKDGFDFLGQNVRKYSGKLLIKPSKKSVKTFLGKVRKIIKEHPMQTGWGIDTNAHPRYTRMGVLPSPCRKQGYL